MGLFAIGDLHLPGGQEKPMNVFGDQWENHFDRIAASWRACVGAEDTVLIPGDISWAMQLRDAVEDLTAIAALPGRKLMIRGNHDYWWAGITQVRSVLPEGLEALQNDAVDVGEAVVCGSRGWTFPTGDAPLDAGDEKIYQRELLRLRMSLDAGMKLKGDRPLVVMLHYPPLYDMARDTGFTALLEEYSVHTVTYGHLHGAGVRIGFQGTWHGIRYQLTSCDSQGFQVRPVPLEEQTGVPD